MLLTRLRIDAQEYISAESGTNNDSIFNHQGKPKLFARPSRRCYGYVTPYFSRYAQMNQAIHNAAVERFAQEGYLDDAQLRDLTSTGVSGGLKSLLVRGVVPELSFANAIGSLHQCRVLSRAELPSTSVAEVLGLSAFLLEHEVLPLSLDQNTLQLAMCDPSDEFILQVLRAKLAVKIEPQVALRSELLEVLQNLYSDSSQASEVAATNIDIPDDLESESGLVRDLHRLLQRAVSLGASDIHFEPVEQVLRVRFRVHGMLRDAHQFRHDQTAQVIARIKLMAKLDVTERRQAQNGRFKFPADGRTIDLRVATLPLHDGESIVLRLLEFALSQSSLTELGLNADVAEALQQAISSQQGLLLVTGPTGSGKSTTLYSLLNQLNSPERKLISIEDPVELNIPGVNQIQVDHQHGLSFAQALRSVLRQDPDVIMVGEIRDKETAQLAAQAALTGHLVLCTLHTSSAASAITRLHNLGLPEYLISATLKGVLAQRLLRTRCLECAEAADPSACSHCAGSRYSARTTIAEFLDASAFERAGANENKLAGALLGNSSLYDDAQRLVAAGTTDHAEVFRVLGAPDSKNV